MANLKYFCVVAGVCFALGCSGSASEQRQTSADPVAAQPNPNKADLVNVITHQPPHPWPPIQVPLIQEGGSPEEGMWKPVPEFVRHNPGAPPLMFHTVLSHTKTGFELKDDMFVPPPATPGARRYIVRMVAWDPEQTSLHMVAGTATPNADLGRKFGKGRLPRDMKTLSRVVAAFNGGWRTKHAPLSGMMTNQTLVREPGGGQATVASFDDGHVEIGTWPTNPINLPPGLLHFRQNLAPLYENGVYNPHKRPGTWGFTNGVATADGQWTVRSGLCRTRDGYGLYIWGEHMTHEQLVVAMDRAQCAYGVHLDMNFAWSTWEYYNIKGPRDGRAGLDWQGVNIGPESPSVPPRYLKKDPKDFFYLLREPTLPSSALGDLEFTALPQPGSNRRLPALVRATHKQVPGVRMLMWNMQRFQKPSLPADTTQEGGLQLMFSQPEPDNWDTALVYDRNTGEAVINDRSGAKYAGWVLARGTLLLESTLLPEGAKTAKIIAQVGGMALWMEGPREHFKQMFKIALALGCDERMLLVPENVTISVRTLAKDKKAWVTFDGFSNRGTLLKNAEDAPEGSLLIGLPAEQAALSDLFGAAQPPAEPATK